MKDKKDLSRLSFLGKENRPNGPRTGNREEGLSLEHLSGLEAEANFQVNLICILS